jgi:glycine/D-amino acid oxidase-like deaminating enzyme
MAVADKAASHRGQAAPDLLIAGAGVAGLWLAVKAARTGLSVTLVERGNPGDGASGGFLGALMPHSPERWNGKKDFQFRALVDLEDEIARLEAETGENCGYRRADLAADLGARPHRRYVTHSRCAGQLGFAVWLRGPPYSGQKRLAQYPSGAAWNRA